MPRLMSVALTLEQVRDRSKTVTRRKSWMQKGRFMLAPGDPLVLCEKVQGRKPGEPLVRIVTVTVVSVRRERLDAITPADVIAEGFPEYTPAWFVAFFCGTHPACLPSTVVTRIEWRYPGPLDTAPGGSGQESGATLETRAVRCPDLQAAGAEAGDRDG
jgi:hypothetical protein